MTTTQTTTSDSIKIGEVYQVNRFATGVQEKCGTGLYLPAEDYIIPRRFSQTTQVNQIKQNNHQVPFSIAVFRYMRQIFCNVLFGSL